MCAVLRAVAGMSRSSDQKWVGKPNNQVGNGQSPRQFSGIERASNWKSRIQVGISEMRTTLEPVPYIPEGQGEFHL